MLKSLAVVAALAAGATAQQSLNINTVFASQCLPTMLTWGGGTPPYWVTVIQGGSATNPVLQNVIGPTTDTAVTWIANIGAGTNIAYSIRDSTGAQASSGSFNVAQGNTDCMQGNPNESLTATQSGSSAAPSVTGTPTGGEQTSASGTETEGGAGGATDSAASAASSATDAAGSAVSSGTDAAGSAVTSATGTGTGAATGATSAPATTSGTASGTASASATGNNTALTNSASFGAVVVAVIGAAVAAF